MEAKIDEVVALLKSVVEITHDNNWALGSFLRISSVVIHLIVLKCSKMFLFFFGWHIDSQNVYRDVIIASDRPS